MFIKTITLCGNKRLLPADIKYLHIDFTNTHQIILGLNGSGKSSTIQELNPMPAVPADYVKGGYKHIVIEHQNQEYVLHSDISVHVRHSFLLNGIELNEGGTAAVQKTLVLEHFNLDQSLIEVLTDQARFHLFSPVERRNWLTRLSGTNMDYAIGLFKHIKSLHRDSEAIVKHIDARLAKESADVVSPEELEELEKYCKELETTVFTLLEHKTLAEGNPDTTLNELKRLTSECQSLSEHIVSLKFVKPLEGIYDKDRLNQFKYHTESQLANLINRKQTLVEEWSKINEAIKTVEMSEHKDLDVIDAEALNYLNQRNTLLDSIKHYPNIKNPEPLWGATDAIRNTLVHKVTELSDNSDQMFTRDKVDFANDRVDRLRQEINSIGNTVERYRISIGRMVETEEVHCPECATIFKPGVDPLMVAELKTKVEERNLEIETLKQELETVHDYLAQAHSYTEEYRSLLKLMDDSPSLEPMWEDMKLVDLKVYPPSKLLEILDNWERDLKIHLKCLSLTNEVVRLDGVREKLKAVVSSEVNYTQTRLNEVTDEIEQNVVEQKRLRETLANIEASLTSHDEIMKGYERLIELNAKHRKLKDLFLEQSVQKELRDMISRLNLSLANSDQRLRSIRRSRHTLQELEEQKLEALDRRDVLKAIIKELNPTDGLIAKQSKLFIEQFVDQLNKVINAVWTYEMQILPCPVESEKLTYKFPIYFSATDVANPDIAKSSAAQKGIVDFAFKLVAMAYLGLNDYPLFLDELAPSLDEKHRVNIMEFVKNFVESKQCSQMFMISHYLTGHGVFSSAQVTVLDDTNLLTLPDSYNKHATISSKMKPWLEPSAVA